jgi:hypothetical protein
METQAQAMPSTPRREPWNKGKLIGQTSCVRQVQQIDHVERALVGFQVNSSIPLFDRK